ncbi:MAG: LacI family DNA-binding transcriptional regulator [Rhodococcus sp. (in: high G+C Gram-positive bacteria)]|uniref:LacI family DNA-binding transcriptional regulator n=1 Tax=Rhodococcus sp. TaxID=1831 RepID=UPI003BB5A350
MPSPRAESPRPTIVDVARASGVSKSLVSLALSGKPGVSDASRARIRQVADELGYISNTWARSLVEGRTHLVGVVTTDVGSTYNTDVVTGIEDEAAESGYGVLLAHGRRDPEQLSRGVERMLQLGVDGLIVVSSRVPRQKLENAARKRPVVVVGRPDDASDLVDIIRNDDELGGRLAVEHLARCGHRRIGYVATSTRAAVRARGLAYERTMTDLGLDYRWHMARTASHDQTFAGLVVQSLRGEPADRRPTALFVSTDETAIAVLGAALDAGLRVPGDLALVGYNNSAIATAIRPTLTSIDQPRNRMGSLAVSLLQERLSGRTRQRVEVMTPHLEVRASSGPWGQVHGRGRSAEPVDTRLGPS